MNAHSYCCVQVLIVIALMIIAVSVSGCNPYHTPIVIDPVTEIRQNHNSVSESGATIHVPEGWELRSHHPSTDKGGPSLRLERYERGQVSGSLHYVHLDEPPEWVRTSTDGVIKTGRHKDVYYWVESEREAYGDDAPASYVLRAWIDGQNWEMSVGFTSPVDPNIETAVQYVDAIEFVENKSE